MPAAADTTSRPLDGLAATATPGAAAPAVTRYWGPLAAVCLAQLLLMLDVTIVIVALPQIQADLHGSLRTMQWVIDVYALMLAALMLNTGAIADRIGRRRVFLIGLGVFGVASALCGAAPTLAVLIFARGLQGIGGAMLFATGLAILGAQYQGHERARALGIFGAVFGGSVALGPLVGGAIIQLVSWRWIFLVNLPVVAVAFWVAAHQVTETRDRTPRAVDVPGQLTFSVGIISLVCGLVEGGDWGWAAPGTLAMFGLAVVSLGLFVSVERRHAQPMFDLGLLRERSFCGASIAAFATSAPLFGMFVYLTLWFQRVEGFDGLSAGLRLLPVTITAFVAAVLAGRLSAVLSPRFVLTGALGSTAVGLLQMTALKAGSPWTVALPGLILTGIGFGLANPTVAAVTLAVAPPERAATATGMNSTFRQVGVAAGVAGLGAIFDHALKAGGPAAARSAASPDVIRAYATGLDRVFVAGFAIAATGAVLAFVLVQSKPAAVLADEDLTSGPDVAHARER